MMLSYLTMEKIRIVKANTQIMARIKYRKMVLETGECIAEQSVCQYRGYKSVQFTNLLGNTKSN